MTTIRYKYITFQHEFSEPSERYNIISCTYFRMKTGYKNEYKYYKGLESLVDLFETQMPNFYLRLYYDDSILDYKTPEKIKNTKTLWAPLFKRIRQNKKIQLVKFDMKHIPEFKEDDIHHNGLIGTLTRFYPLLDTEYNKNIDTVAIMDVDIYPGELKDTYDRYQKMIKMNVDFFFMTRNCYELQDRFQILRKHFNVKFSMLAGRIISRLKFPINLFEEFLYCVINSDDTKCEYYKIFKEFEYNKYHLQYEFEKMLQNKKIKYYIKFGVDEVFCLLMKKFLLENKIKHIMLIDNNIEKSFYDMYIYYDTKKINDKQFENTLKYLMEKSYDSNKTPLENYKILDSIIYFKKDTTELSRKIILDRAKTLVKKILNKELDKKDYAFTELDSYCILDSSLERKFYLISYTDRFDNNIEKLEIS